MAELIAKRYGQALFELAYESGDLTKREQEIRQMLDALTHDDDFFVLLNHPKLSKAEKIAVLEKIFAGKVSDELVGFLVLAVEKGRQDCIVDILNYTLKKIEEHNGYVTAHVTTAIELSETAMTDIRTSLRSRRARRYPWSVMWISPLSVDCLSESTTVLWTTHSRARFIECQETYMRQKYNRKIVS